MPALRAVPPYREARINQSNGFLPKAHGLPDDFVQLLFGGAAAESEGAGEMFPIVQRQPVKFAGDEDFQRGPLFRPQAFQSGSPSKSIISAKFFLG